MACTVNIVHIDSPVHARRVRGFVVCIVGGGYVVIRHIRAPSKVQWHLDTFTMKTYSDQ